MVVSIIVIVVKNSHCSLVVGDNMIKQITMTLPVSTTPAKKDTNRKEYK